MAPGDRLAAAEVAAYRTAAPALCKTGAVPDAEQGLDNSFVVIAAARKAALATVLAAPARAAVADRMAA